MNFPYCHNFLNRLFATANSFLRKTYRYDRSVACIIIQYFSSCLPSVVSLFCAFTLVRISSSLLLRGKSSFVVAVDLHSLRQGDQILRSPVLDIEVTEASIIYPKTHLFGSGQFLLLLVEKRIIVGSLRRTTPFLFLPLGFTFHSQWSTMGSTTSSRTRKFRPKVAASSNMMQILPPSGRHSRHRRTRPTLHNPIWPDGHPSARGTWRGPGIPRS